MRTQTEENRRRIVDAAYESFWRLGFRRSSVESIATRAGLTKRTLYGYFRSKDDLLAAVLQRYEELAAERLKHIGDRLPADRIGLLDSFFGQLNEWASSTPRWSGSGFTRLVVELADLPGHPARVIARRAKRKTEAWLAERLDQARVGAASARAREIMLLMEGSMALTLIHGGREYIDTAARVAKQLVTQSARDELEPAEADARNARYRGGRAKNTQSDARRRSRLPRVQATPAR
jgi:AcrR family transcriptional regulator